MVREVQLSRAALQERAEKKSMSRHLRLAAGLAWLDELLSLAMRVQRVPRLRDGGGGLWDDQGVSPFSVRSWQWLVHSKLGLCPIVASLVD